MDVTKILPSPRHFPIKNKKSLTQAKNFCKKSRRPAFSICYCLSHLELRQEKQKSGGVRVRLSPTRDMQAAYVRFTPESGHSPTRSGCPLWAISRHHLG